MYNELIQQARDLCSEATDAPWELYDTPNYTEIHVQGGRDAGFSPVALADEKYNATFIASSRTLIPQLCDALEAMTARAEKAEAENRWIPVNKRLPKITEYRNENRYKSMDSNELVPFLVCCKDTEIPFRAFYDGKNWGDGWNKLKVTHWMPLPEMPKEAVAMRLEERGREYKHGYRTTVQA